MSARSRFHIARIVFGVLAVSVFISCVSEDPLPPPLPINDAVVLRGRELVEGVGSCGFCHSMDGQPGTPLAGGRLMQDPYGEVRGPNITLAKSGIKTWTEADIQRLFRLQTTPDDRKIDSAVHGGFEWLSDGDVAAITGYLRTVAPVERDVSEREISFVTRNTTGILRGSREVKGYVPQVLGTFKVPFGQYLADHVARCASCHNSPGGIIDAEEYWAGGREISFDGEQKIAPNITTSKTSGIGDWSEEDVRTYLVPGRFVMVDKLILGSAR